MATNNPLFAKLATYSEHQLLVLILTEARIQTQILADEFGVDEDLNAMRLEAMNSNDIVSGDGG